MGIVAPVFNTVVVSFETIQVHCCATATACLLHGFQQRVQHNTQELQKITASVSSLMKLILVEATAHGESRFEAECRALNESHNIRDTLETYRRKISNKRADITIVRVDRDVTGVQCAVMDVQQMNIRDQIVRVDRDVTGVQCAVMDVQQNISTLQSHFAIPVPVTGWLGISTEYSNEPLSVDSSGRVFVPRMYLSVDPSGRTRHVVDPASGHWYLEIVLKLQFHSES
ncbi:hypothetical protein C8R44DRAFT_734812 [Mycena epipterygia]|nr:hypothetical protein C8R44DRAFT_734812 [Mycena epipterygia]